MIFFLICVAFIFLHDSFFKTSHIFGSFFHLIFGMYI